MLLNDTPNAAAATTEAGTPTAVTPELSVVIPLYNGGAYFRATMESLLAQTLERSRFEVVIVDDGSTDDSAAYCDRLAAEHPGFIRVFHQENSGSPAGPRNDGARLARGEYIFFVDADDLVPPASFENMLRHARDKQLDIGVFKVDASSWNQTYGGLFDHPQDDCRVDNSPIMNSLGPYKLIRRSIIVDNDLRFPENILYEDLPFVLECYLHATRISIITDMVYYVYCARDDGGSISQGVGEKHLDEQVEGVAHYFKVASRYASSAQCPHIFLRGYRYLDYALPHIINQKRDDLLARSIEVAREHYCDQVRSLMPFSMMSRIDVLVSEQTALLASIIRQQPLLAFTGRTGSGEATTYELRALKEQKGYPEKPDFAHTLPANCGWGRPQLENPQIAHCLINGAKLNDDSISFSGQLQILMACSGAPAEARLRSSLNTTAPASMEFHLSERVYADVWHVKASWSARMPLANLQPEDPSKQTLHFYLDVDLPSGKTIEIRFGKDRLAGVFGQFARQASVSSTWVFTPTETAAKNMSLNAVPLAIAKSPSLSLGLGTSRHAVCVNADGLLTFDNLPDTRIELSLIDRNGQTIAQTKLAKGTRRGDRRFQGSLVLPKLEKGRYSLVLAIKLGNTSLSIPLNSARIDSPQARRLFTPYLLEHSSSSLHIVVG